MLVRHLTSVDGDLVFDIDPELAPVTAVVLVDDDVTLDDTRQLARTTTFRSALFEERTAGAAAGIRPRLIDTTEETVARVADELAAIDDELVDGGGITPEIDVTASASVARGVIAAAAAWLGGLEGRTLAIGGFDARHEAVARAAVEGGATLVGVATSAGAVADGSGLDLDALVTAREAHGDAFVTRLDLEVHRTEELLGLAVDVLVPGGGPRSLDRARAESVQARVLAPATPLLCTGEGLDMLRRRQVVPLPEHACLAGPFLEARAPGGLARSEIEGRARRLIGERIEAARLAKMDPVRYTTTLAATYLATWVPESRRPDRLHLDG